LILFIIYYLLFKLGGVPSCTDSLSKHPHYPNILIKTKTNMPATTKRQKTAHATHFPRDVLAHILSYCEDPMILYKRQHARVWRTISVCTNGWRNKIWATVNGERKTMRLGKYDASAEQVWPYMREHTNYEICPDCGRCIMHTPYLDCPDCYPPTAHQISAGVQWYGEGGVSFLMMEDDSDSDSDSDY
jgi:hypothetical protein